MRWKAWAAFGVAAAMAWAGCGPTTDTDTASDASDQVGEGSQLFTEGQGARAVREVAYDTAWSFGGTVDTLLAAPSRLSVAPGGGVYVLDVGTNQVLRISGGQLAWSWGSSGEGPGELRRVRAMAVDVHTGGPVLVDSGNRRLVRLSSDGTLLGEQSFTSPVWTTEDLVALSDGSGYVASSYGMDGATLLRISLDGATHESVTPDWPGFREMEMIQLGMALFVGAGDMWGLAFKTGNGFWVVAGDSARAHPYVVHTDFPAIADQETTEGSASTRRVALAAPPVDAAYDVDSRGDTLFVLASDSDEDGEPVLDLYSLTSGLYLESRRLPGGSSIFALAGDTIFVVDRGGLVPSVLSLVPSES